MKIWIQFALAASVCCALIFLPEAAIGFEDDCGDCWADDDYGGSGQLWHKNPQAEWGDLTNPHGNYIRGSCKGSYLHEHNSCIETEQEEEALGRHAHLSVEEIREILNKPEGGFTLDSEAGFVQQWDCDQRHVVAVYPLTPQQMSGLAAQE